MESLSPDECGEQRFGFRPGRRIGPYVLEHELGAGAQGRVFRARHEKLGRTVALKVMGSDGRFGAAERRRFELEAELASNLDHPGICTVYEMGEDDGLVWIAMQYVEGMPLDEVIRASRDSGTTSVDFSFVDFEADTVMLEGPVGEAAEREPERRRPSRAEIADTVTLIEAAARALHAAHEAGLVHRDIKPANMMITQARKPVILDFGLARRDGGEALTVTGAAVGSPAYMSPEQVSGGRFPVDARSDIWSLGITLYECLTLERPFQGGDRPLFDLIRDREPPSVRELNGAVPSDLAAIVETTLTKERSRRYQTALDLAEDLRRVRDGRPVSVKRAGPGTKVARWARRNPLVAALVAAVVLVTTTASIVLLVQNRSLFEESDAKSRALADFDRMADVKRLQEAEADAAKLWPARPPMIGALEAWLDRYAGLADELDAHRATVKALEASARPYSASDRESDHGVTLAEMRAVEARRDEIDALLDGDPSDGEATRLEDELDALDGKLEALGRRVRERKTWRFDGPQADLTAWKRDVMAELVGALGRFVDPDQGTLASVRRRLETARTIEKSTVDDHREGWDAAIARVASHDDFGFAMKPQVGLVPLGPDPRSTLEEFLHVDTHAGPLPTRGEDGRFAVTGETGVILVLLPAGRFWMGAQKEDANGHNFDPHAEQDEPLHEVTIARPFLISKFEMTQGQWARTPAPTPRPSMHGPGMKTRGNAVVVDDRHPVEQVSLEDCRLVLPRVGLTLPTDVQWEYAARAGKGTIWPGVASKREIPEHGNIAGAEVAPHTTWAHETSLSDEWVGHAPVGSFLPNAFGLHDMLGNVFEWTSSPWGPRMHVYRGGSFGQGARFARVANRNRLNVWIKNVNLGARPARIVSD